MTFARTLAELRDTALELPSCRIWACAAAVETTGRGPGGHRGAARRRALDARVPARGGRRAPGGRLTRVAVVALALLLAGCGSRPPDLFVVERSGADRNANVRLLVSDGGSVRCDGKEHPLDAERLLTARQLLRDLEPQAELGIELPAGPGTQLSYRASMEGGTIAFSDRSEGVPNTFQRLAAFTTDVTERVCGIER